MRFLPKWNLIFGLLLQESFQTNSCNVFNLMDIRLFYEVCNVGCYVLHCLSRVLKPLFQSSQKLVRSSLRVLASN